MTNKDRFNYISAEEATELIRWLTMNYMMMFNDSWGSITGWMRQEWDGKDPMCTNYYTLTDLDIENLKPGTHQHNEDNDEEEEMDPAEQYYQDL